MPVQRILVIDDESQLRAMLKKFLEMEGYEVITASNGKEGLHLFSEDPADLVITDLIMPDKEGIETIKELKASNPKTKVIAMSGGGKGGTWNLSQSRNEDGRCKGLYQTLRAQCPWRCGEGIT